jgi:hypothetical protein
MSVSRVMQQAAAGNAGDAVYVDDLFSTYLYDGTGSAQTITNGIDLAGEGGLVWIKNRSTSADHHLGDTARGVSAAILHSNSSGQGTDYGAYGFTGFNSDGFTINGAGSVGLDASGNDYVSWTFRKQPGFFDVVTWSGDGTTNRQISHSLGSTPGMIIVKSRTGSDNWYTYHRSLGSGKFVKLNSADAAFTDTPGDMWGNTDPTDSVFTVGNPGYLNYSGWDYVAYVFAHDAQDFGENSDEAIIKCGSYTGNTSSKPNIDLGFEPQWLIIKCTTHSESWIILDSMRGIVTPDNSGTGIDPTLLANNTTAELSASSNSYIKLHANGFELTSTGGEVNAAGREYIYMAIRRPHKPASEFAATDLFKPVVKNFTAGLIETGFPVDLNINFGTSADDYNRFTSRLTGQKSLYSDRTAAEGTETYWDFAESEGMGVTYSGNISGYSNLCFKRAPGFFDVVTYEGIGGPQNINHNLGVAPELIIVKDRDASVRWAVWYNGIGTDASGYNKYLVLNQTDGDITGGSVWFDMVPTASVFRPYDAFVSEGNRSYVAYLFATATGISKVGTYTGTGSNVDVDCGFSAGARFVLVKRTDSTGDWYFWDTARGIVAGNDPYHRFNVGYPGGQDITNTDYIDPLSSGFTITSTAPAALNASGGTYLFLAIA